MENKLINNEVMPYAERIEILEQQVVGLIYQVKDLNEIVTKHNKVIGDHEYDLNVVNKLMETIHEWLEDVGRGIEQNATIMTMITDHLGRRAGSSKLGPTPYAHANFISE